ncbi:MAG: nucleotidyltransferase domain-containing protein [Mariprofundus sp.]|nr:nucleotidyltransferase domain-containing protein [Mariprofundus sp.]
MIDIKEIHTNISNAAARLCAKEAWLFGSYARGEASEDSDVDILFIIDNESSHLNLIRSARKTMRDWHVPKDILVYRNDEFQDWQKVVGSLCYRVKKEGVQLYEA